MILKLHAETPIVKGYLRSCIYDLSRKTHDFIPNEIGYKMLAYENMPADVIAAEFDDDDKQWLNYFLDKEYAFFIDEAFAECFPKIDFTWLTPSLITNAIIDISPSSPGFNYKYLEQLNCKHLLLRFFGLHNPDDIIKYLDNAVKDFTFKSIDVVIEKNPAITKKEYSVFAKALLKQVRQITSLNFAEEKKEEGFVPQLVLNIDTFSEGQSYNTYFNRKLYISATGDIKNSIEDTVVHGNIKDIESYNSFRTITEKQQFQKNGDIKKDDISVCKDCEFRYMCIDNRIPQPSATGGWYFEKECAYNPYIAKWKGEDNYHTLKEAGIVLEAGEIKLDMAIIDELNQLIWV